MDILKRTTEYNGTTGIVAKNLGFDYILVEINPEYIEIINKRLQS